MTTSIATYRSSHALDPARRGLSLSEQSKSSPTRKLKESTPENIVAFTFTEKSAAELKDRITRLYVDTFGNVEGLAGMYVGTIHGFCLNLLQDYVPEYLKYDVLDEIGQRLLIDRNSTKSGMKGLGLRRWVQSNIYMRFLGILREAEVDASKLTDDAVETAYEAYQDLLEKKRYLDFDNILIRAVEEVTLNEGLREDLRKRLKYLTVDEYQDINPIQERLIWALHDLGAKRLCGGRRRPEHLSVARFRRRAHHRVR